MKYEDFNNAIRSLDLLSTRNFNRFSIRDSGDDYYVLITKDLALNVAFDAYELRWNQFVDLMFEGVHVGSIDLEEVEMVA